MLFAAFRAFIKLLKNLLSKHYLIISKMEIETAFIEPVFLIEKTEAYGKLSFELLKLKSLDKTADITSTLISRLLLVMVVSLFIVMANTAIALWLGSLLGRDYYGFFGVALFYGVIAMILFFIHPMIKARVNDSIIAEMLN